MADLKIAEAKTLKWEGGYCNIPGDKGGETIFGIARNMHPDLKLWKDVDNYKEGLKPFDKSKYKELETLCKGNGQFMESFYSFYKTNFWDKIKGDEINSQAVANALYDFAVNSGVKTAVKKIQQALQTFALHKNLTADGIMGPKTLEAINEQDERDICNKLCDKRSEFFNEIAKKGQNAKFLKGWLNRVKDFYI